MNAGKSEAGPARSAAGRLLRRLAVAAVSTAVLLAAAEGGHRLWLRARGEPYDRVALQRSLLRGLDTTAAFAGAPAAKDEEEVEGSFPVLHPFFGAEKYPDTGGVLRFFEHGNAEDRYTVLVLGGSVAAFWALDQDGAFRDRLRADPRFAGREVQLLMGAHSSYKQPQQIGRLAWLLAFGHRPDVVIELDGFNEVALSYGNARFARTNPLYPSPPVWGAVLRDRRDSDESLELLVEMRALQNETSRLVHRSLDLHLALSSLLGRWLEHRVDALNARRNELRTAYLAQAGGPDQSKHALKQRFGADYGLEEDAIMTLAAASWFEGSRSLHAMCSELGIHYLHVLQPTLLDEGSKPLTDRERGYLPGPPGWQRGVELGYPLLRERGARLARLGIAYLDASQCFAGVEGTLYNDTCHFGPAGNRILSERIADALLATLPDAADGTGSARPAGADTAERGSGD